jgi:hypothetical protein
MIHRPVIAQGITCQSDEPRIYLLAPFSPPEADSDGYPVKCFASSATGDQSWLSWLILRPVRAVRRTRQDEAT